jgi:hypothetical protein
MKWSTDTYKIKDLSEALIKNDIEAIDILSKRGVYIFFLKGCVFYVGTAKNSFGERIFASAKSHKVLFKKGLRTFFLKCGILVDDNWPIRFFEVQVLNETLFRDHVYVPGGKGVSDDILNESKEFFENLDVAFLNMENATEDELKNVERRLQISMMKFYFECRNNRIAPSDLDQLTSLFKYPGTRNSYLGGKIEAVEMYVGGLPTDGMPIQIGKILGIRNQK